MKRFIAEGKYTDFGKFDFSQIKQEMERLKEERKNMPDEEKKKIKDKKE